VLKFHRLAGAAITLALMISFAACSGGDDKDAPEDQAVLFPEVVVKDDLLVRVNSHPVFGRDLLIFAHMYMPGAEDSLRNSRFNVKMLDGMIDRTLLWLEADAVGVTINDSTMQWFAQQFAAVMGGETAVMEMLSAGGFTRSDLEGMIRKDLMIRSFLENNVLQQPAVSDSIAMAFYQQNPADFVAPDSIHARHIILRASQDDTPSDIDNKKQTLRDLQTQIAGGEDFEELAKQYSEGPSAPRGGDLGYFTRREMVPEFSNVAFGMEVGEVSGVVVTQFGYHLIKIDDKVASRQLTYDEVKDDLKIQLVQYFQSQALQNHLQRSRAVAIIERNF
jgi:peptidyl-prolyl cis-trans isomerase C